MGIVRALPELEAWLDADASSWSSLPDPGIQGARSVAGPSASHRSSPRAPPASKAIGRFNLSNLGSPPTSSCSAAFRCARLANMGGRGAAAYAATGLRGLRRDLANRMELVLASDDLAWSCVFSHEAGAFVWEHLYVWGPDA